MAVSKLKRKGKSKSIDCIIDDCLYLGDAKISKDLNLLKTVGITHIICVAGKAAFENDFVYHISHFKDKQDTDMIQLLPSIFDFIDTVIVKEKTKIYVHCMAGMSRSPSIIMAYLMYKFNLTLKQSYIYVINKRQCIRPNYVFLQQLWKYEKVIFGDNFENSINTKDLRNISILYKKKWKKDLKKEQTNFDQINLKTIIRINKQKKKRDDSTQNEENKDDL